MTTSCLSPMQLITSPTVASTSISSGSTPSSIPFVTSFFGCHLLPPWRTRAATEIGVTSSCRCSQSRYISSSHRVADEHAGPRTVDLLPSVQIDVVASSDGRRGGRLTFAPLVVVVRLWCLFLLLLRLQVQSHHRWMLLGLGIKFAVSVRGHRWHVIETLQELANAIQRNVQQLEFIEGDGSIRSLQLTNGKEAGSEPEDLDMDLTLGDVTICTVEKQLVAVFDSARALSILNAAVTPQGCSPVHSHVGFANMIGPARHRQQTQGNSSSKRLQQPGHGPNFMFPPHKPSRAALIF